MADYIADGGSYVVNVADYITDADSYLADVADYITSIGYCVADSGSKITGASSYMEDRAGYIADGGCYVENFAGRQGTGGNNQEAKTFPCIFNRLVHPRTSRQRNPDVCMDPTLDAEPPFEMDGDDICMDLPVPAPGGAFHSMLIPLALKLKELALNGLKTLARAIKTGITTNPDLPDLKYTPAEIEAAVVAVEQQEANLATAEGEVVTQRGILDQKVNALEVLITAVCTDCQTTVKDLPEPQARTILQSANIPLRAEREAAPPAQRPTSFFVNRSDHDGAVDGGCDRDKNAKLYRVRGGQNPNGPFEVKYEGTKSSFTLVNQPAGETWYQMAAFGVNGGWSEWSDPARCVVV